MDSLFFNSHWLLVALHLGVGPCTISLIHFVMLTVLLSNSVCLVSSSRSSLDNHIVEVSWVQLLCQAQVMLSCSWHPGFLDSKYFCPLFCHFPWALGVGLYMHQLDTDVYCVSAGVVHLMFTCSLQFHPLWDSAVVTVCSERNFFGKEWERHLPVHIRTSI